MNKHFIFAILLFVLISCNKEENDNPSDNIAILKGSRTVALDLNEAGSGEYAAYENGFDLVVADFKIAEVKQSWDWSTIETESGWDFTTPDIANSFFPAKNMPVSLIFRPINTVARGMPEDLKDLDFDDPEILTRFKTFIDSVKLHAPNLKVNSVYVGNEIDMYLNGNSEEWDKFSFFFEGATEHIKEVWGPNIKTGTIGTMNGLIQENLVSEFSKLHQLSDVVAVTYYPIDENFEVKGQAEISKDFDKLVELYGSEEIIFVECGFPTSTANASSDSKQVEFVRSIFTNWDKYVSQINHIDFTWLFDLSAAEAEQLNEFYQVSDSRFEEYLRTLGFRTNDGQAKPGYNQLKEELQKRGW